ncbi:hypothetical protein H0G86_010949 [Trichoderma simmonsii]|uniref:Uncharacterized protein n=1 Tax=Trichoderma simmonsii TaxID=1491479 RepID=A0A8G0PLU8_9HYPO|nr:hypothetical protein H0G86_010949 [Trichoderma simmonsii]
MVNTGKRIMYKRGSRQPSRMSVCLYTLCSFHNQSTYTNPTTLFAIFPRHKLFDTDSPGLHSSSHDDEVDLVPHFCGRLHCTWDGLSSRPPLLRTYPLGNG